MHDIFSYNQTVSLLRDFFQREKKYIEVPVQSRLSILAACEDPKTISPFYFSKIKYPLPQTGQMWLEHEILKNPSIPGVFCISTSYRDEPNPIEGRHDKIFPMFEFEGRGDMNKMRQLEQELLEYLEFSKPITKDYNNLLSHYKVEELTFAEEEKMCQEFSNVISLENFPLFTDPFWNMKEGNNNLFNKIDVILHGMETIGSAERETNPEKMRDNFYTISNGEYAKLLFSNFGQKRVEEELENYLSLPMTPRFGGGIGITRLIRAMKLEKSFNHNLIKSEACIA